jgi:hypothetical protein
MTEPAAFITEGALLQTRSGLKARVICTDRKDSIAPVLALVTGIHGNEAIFSYLPNGWRWKGGESDEDLVETPPAVARVPREWRLVEDCGRVLVQCFEERNQISIGEKVNVVELLPGWKLVPDDGREVLPEGEVTAEQELLSQFAKLCDRIMAAENCMASFDSVMDRVGYLLRVEKAYHEKEKPAPQAKALPEFRYFKSDNSNLRRIPTGCHPSTRSEVLQHSGWRGSLMTAEQLLAGVAGSTETDEHGTPLVKPAPERFRYLAPSDPNIGPMWRSDGETSEFRYTPELPWTKGDCTVEQLLQWGFVETTAEGLPVNPNP